MLRLILKSQPIAYMTMNNSISLALKASTNSEFSVSKGHQTTLLKGMYGKIESTKLFLEYSIHPFL